MPSAAKLRERMRQTKSGWSKADLFDLYVGFGFRCRQGAKHVVCVHRDHPDLRATISRARELPVGYIETALELLDKLDRRAGASEDG